MKTVDAANIVVVDTLVTYGVEILTRVAAPTVSLPQFPN